MIIFNVLIGAAFVYSNYHIWNSLSKQPYATAGWNPFIVSYVPRSMSDGELVSDGVLFLANYPFWLFWFAMIGNMAFAVLILKSKKTF